jgi:hypothetical protein
MVDHESIAWVRWTPENASTRPDVAAALSRFSAPATPAGDAATAWLQEESLASHPSTITWLGMSGDEILGFFALCSSSVEMRRDHRRQAGSDSPLSTQPAALVAWFAVASTAAGTGMADLMLRRGVFTARRAAEDQGALVLVVDPFDESAARYWRERHGFRTAKHPASGDPRLWIRLHPQEDG